MAKKAKAATAAKQAVKKSGPRITPLGDRVLVKPLAKDDQKSPAGIILPDTVDREKTDRGTVIAVGKGKRDDNGKMHPPAVKEGDKVLFQWGEKVELNDEEYYIVGESNILAILK